MSTLLDVIRVCEEHMTEEHEYVYKKCIMNDVKQFIVMMHKIDGVPDNEQRKDIVDRNYAKFRAAELKVILIVAIDDTNERPLQLTNRFKQHMTTYIVGQVVTPHEYDPNINEVCSGGRPKVIHYFRSVLPAYLYRFIPKTHTGKCTTWHDNGIISADGECVNGIINGKWRGCN
jgi:hypothetical protein